ncbi:hypothetical protein F383_34922 [Gossypium arboreum]|uniref:Uncharacterized protein n=1 Tax=Gossypium arboreum TaxID=29729 RepID=A0A0B0PU39_GOSAR|nr:hypothetical protein F383_34922 [Gossypium arboreum]
MLGCYISWYQSYGLVDSWTNLAYVSLAIHAILLLVIV